MDNEVRRACSAVDRTALKTAGDTPTSPCVRSKTMPPTRRGARRGPGTCKTGGEENPP